MEKKLSEQYEALNKLAGPGGTVIMGGRSDLGLPLGELKQAFGLEDNLYNRSVDNLSVRNAAGVYDACIAQLAPSVLLLHIGEEDRALFQEESGEFDRGCRELVSHIRSMTPGCEVVMVSQELPDAPGEMESVRELNRHLKYIAESEQCRYEDISSKHVWNPDQTKEVVAFVRSVGFVRPLRQKKPVYDLVRTLYGYQDGETA